jgi:hypothetical protein
MRWLLGLFRKTPAHSAGKSNSQSEEERESLVA